MTTLYRALKVAKEVADQRVERSLYQRAVGYETDAVKIFSSTRARKSSFPIESRSNQTQPQRSSG